MASPPPSSNGGARRSSEAAARQAPKKLPVGATAGSTVTTRTAKPITAEDKHVTDAQKKYTTLAEAMHTLRAQEFVPAGEPTIEGLVAGILLIAAKAGATISDGLVALHRYAQKAIENEVSDRIAVSVTKEITAQVSALVATAESSLLQAGTALQEKIEDAPRIEEAVRSSVERVFASVEGRGNPEPGTGTGEFPPRFPPFSYAAAASAPPPGPERAAQIQVADRERLLARQLLVDEFPFPDEEGANAAPNTLLAIANESLNYVFNTPEGTKFVAARTLANGGVILECAQMEQAQWLREHAGDLESALGGTAKLRIRPYKLVAEFVPISFDPHEPAAWREVEEDVGMPQNSITEARWIKPVVRRHREQRFAHLLLTINSPTAANTLISRGLTLAGKHVSARKNLAEPMRCAKCHRYDARHLARDCPEQKDKCGTCGRAHRTSECTHQDPREHRCAACGKGGHPTWSRDCPIFLDRLRRADARHPENRLRFFPTADPDSWVPQLDEPPRGTLWEFVQDPIDKPPPPPSQRLRAAAAAQARMTQSTLNYSVRSPATSTSHLNDA